MAKLEMEMPDGRLLLHIHAPSVIFIYLCNFTKMIVNDISIRFAGMKIS